MLHSIYRRRLDFDFKDSNKKFVKFNPLAFTQLLRVMYIKTKQNKILLKKTTENCNHQCVLGSWST